MPSKDFTVQRLPAAADDSLRKLLALAFILQSRVFLCVPSAAGIVFLLSLIPLAFLKRNSNKEGNSRHEATQTRMRQTALAMTWLSLFIMSGAAVATYESTSGLQLITTGDFQAPSPIMRGYLLAALQWVLVGLSAAYGIGLSLILKIHRGTVKWTDYEQTDYEQGNGQPPLTPPPPPPAY